MIVGWDGVKFYGQLIAQCRDCLMGMIAGMII